MADWKETTIGELITLQRGHDLTQTNFIDGEYLVAGSNGPIGYHNNFTAKGPGLTIGRSGNSIGVAHYYESNFWAHNTTLYSKVFHNSYPKFIYYLLKLFDFKSFDGGSAVPTLNRNHIHPIPVKVPKEISEQQAIAEVLSSLDDKIDLLHRQNKTLEAMAETLFRQWFVEEAGESWETANLDSFLPVITGKKDANYATENGEYPFFTCSQKISFCDDFSFDGHAILLAGNGDFNLKRYKGKFEAYQRTYVLIPYEEKYIGFLFALMNYFLSEITSSAQGSVISFLTKGMITDYEIRLPENKDLLNERLKVFNEFNEKVDSNLKQIGKLAKLRDELLPKLMSGDEVRVKIEK